MTIIILAIAATAPRGYLACVGGATGLAAGVTHSFSNFWRRFCRSSCLFSVMFLRALNSITSSIGM